MPRFEYLNYRTAKEIFWKTKFTPKQWNLVFNMLTDELYQQGKVSNEQLGVNLENATDRRLASFYRGYMTTCGVLSSTMATLSGSRRPGMVEADLTKPSSVNVWANRYADRLRESALTAHRLNKNFIEKVEASKQPVRGLMETGAYGTSMMSGAVMGVSLANEMLAHGVAVLTGGRKPHMYSIRPTFSSREEAGNHKEDPKHSYAEFMRRSRMYQRRSSQLRFSPAFR